MSQNDDKTTRYWLTGSAENFAKAERDFKLGDNVYALFWLHLAAEKLLKAAITKLTKAPAPYNHDLVYLCQAANVQLDDAQEKFLKTLTVFQLETRYPEDFLDLKKQASNEVTASLFSEFNKFQTWLNQILK